MKSSPIFSSVFLIVTSSLLCSSVALSLDKTTASDQSWFVTAGIGASSTNADNAVQQGPNAGNAPSVGYEVDSNAVYSLGLGYNLGNGIAVQGDLRTREFTTDTGAIAANASGQFAGNTYSVDGEVQSTSLMINAIYDIPNSSAFQPYVKAGIGVAKNEVEMSQQISPLFSVIGDTSTIGSACAGTTYCFPDDSSTEFAWSVGAGVRYNITDTFGVGLDYQYIDLGEAATGVDPNGDKVVYDNLTNHEVVLSTFISF
jgi:opacity protein-like surface antigen